MQATFSSGIKEEIKDLPVKARHCQLSELAVYMSCFGPAEEELLPAGAHGMVKERYRMLMQQAFPGGATARDVLEAVKWPGLKERMQARGVQGKPEGAMEKDIPEGREEAADGRVSELLLKNACCRRAYLRAMYFSCGSVSDPKKGYHCEWACSSIAQGRQLIEILKDFDIAGHHTLRHGKTVVYIKESEAISQLLNVIGAHRSLMDLENLRIEKDLRSAVNRRVNCDTANIQKSVSAAERLCDDIRYLESKGALSSLPDSLREMAEVRLRYPEAPLKELGMYCNPTVGKSGVNHRLRRLSEMARERRKKDGDPDPDDM